MEYHCLTMTKPLPHSESKIITDKLFTHIWEHYRFAHTLSSLSAFTSH